MKQRTVEVIIALSLLIAAPVLQAECMPSLIGSPCAVGGVASASQIEPAITLAAGNPVHLATGNKYQQDVDLPPTLALPGLELVRHYNSMDPRPSVLGRGWTLSYESRLHRLNRGWQIVQADGSRVDFPAGSLNAQGVYQTGHGQLRPGQDHHDWQLPTGTVIQFSPGGHLIAIQQTDGTRIAITRHSDGGPLHATIQAIHNEQGHRLSFHYDVEHQQARLVGVTTPLGRFDYSHDVPDVGPPAAVSDRDSTSHRLVRVTRPDGMQRHYLYEPARQSGHRYALTGIKIVSPHTQDQEHVSTWNYDAQGRAIESISLDSDQVQHRLQFDYQRQASRQQDGLTVVRNPAGGETHFHTAIRGNRHVLMSVQGDGCFGCAAPGTRADYDAAGRLTRINGTQIERTPTGAIRRLQPAGMGWPGLTLSYNDHGLRHHWSSDATGSEHLRYNDQGLPLERRFANGDTITVSYDAQQRPVNVHEQHQGTQTTTQLQWRGHRLTRIDHPVESETRRYDDQGRVSQRTITRDVAGLEGPLHISEQFSYDAQHRLTRHQLPEGGSLHYHWGHGPQITAIYWQNIKGQQRKILETIPGEPGYRYGNGLHLDTAADAEHRVRQLRLRYQDHLIWAQELGYDRQHKITSEHHVLDFSHSDQDTGIHAPQMSNWHYAYDEQSRLAGYRQIATEDTGQNAVWLAWQGDGSAAAIRTDTGTHRPTSRRDASGLASHVDNYDLTYSANRRLQSVTRAGKPLVQYRHNAFGYRIRREDATGRQTDYVYLNNQLVAEMAHHGDRPQSHPAKSEPLGLPGMSDSSGAPGITRRYVYAHHVPVAVIDYSADYPEGQHYAVHADLQGAPRLMTDQDRQVRWHADYTPLGDAVILGGDLHLDLRLPGQVADPATGWHDNLLRTYMPAWGHYLEPDPLGPVPGNQAYGYASQQPRRYADPTGLLLFAFDGTRQTADTRSNVWKMSQYYLDGPVRYHPGPGNSVFIDWDTLTAHQAAQIIDTQWKWLLHELSQPQAATEVTPIDILGFSRGAALARHFGNLIAQHVQQGLFQFNDPFYGAVSACVDLRFMGLFDTVAQFGIAGSQNRSYDLDIAAAWEWVAHAVALHERRRLFPLTAASGLPPHNVVEAPFIGAHSDIGGGVLPATQGDAGGRGDLSNVALNWMLWQARAAFVPFGELGSEHGTINNPILHDFRNPVLRTLQSGDRRVDAADGQRWLNNQGMHPELGQNRRSQTENLIRRHEDWRTRSDAEVGMVDMEGYAQWLHEELGWHALPV